MMIERQWAAISAHEHIVATYPLIMRGGLPDAYGIRAGIQEAVRRQHPKLAAERLRSLYPDRDRWFILYEYPTLTIRGDYGRKGARHFRADLSVIDVIEKKLVAVVEVGQLTQPDKCELWQRLLPDVRVIWIKKAELEPNRFALVET